MWVSSLPPEAISLRVFPNMGGFPKPMLGVETADTNTVR